MALPVQVIFGVAAIVNGALTAVRGSGVVLAGHGVPILLPGAGRGRYCDRHVAMRMTKLRLEPIDCPLGLSPELRCRLY